MKNLLSLSLLLIAIINLNAQNTLGTGVLLHIPLELSPEYSEVYEMEPTSVNDTTSVYFILENSLNASQIVSIDPSSNNSFGFLASSNPLHVFINNGTSYLEVAANSSDTLTFSFFPNEIGGHTLPLVWAGSIYGGGNILIGGEATQTEIFLENDSINLGSTSVGETLEGSFTISNVGTGTLNIQNISSSNDFFSIEDGYSDTSIVEGGSMTIPFSYSSSSSGSHSSIFSIESNDFNNQITSVNAYATSVSNISGDLCGILSLENSPYYAVDFLTIPDSCSLTIEPGVQLYLGEYQMFVIGELITNGTISDSIYIYDGAIIADSSSDFEFNYVRYNSEFDPNAGQVAVSISKNSSYGDACVDSYNGTTYWGENYSLYSISQYSGGCYWELMSENQNAHESSRYLNYFIYEDRSVPESGYYYFEIESVRQYFPSNYSSSNPDMQYRINNGSWVTFHTFSTSYDDNYKNYSKTNVMYLTTEDQIDFRYTRNLSSNSSTKHILNSFNIVHSGNINSPIIFSEDFNDNDLNFTSSYEYTPTIGNSALNFNLDNYIENGDATIEFIAPLDGEYLVSFNYNFETNNGYYNRMYFYVNGEQFYRSQNYVNSSVNWNNRNRQAKVYLNAGEKAELRFYCSSSNQYYLNVSILDIEVNLISISESFLDLVNSKIDIFNSDINPHIQLRENDNTVLSFENSNLSSISSQGFNSSLNVTNSSFKNSNKDAIRFSGDSSYISLDNVIIENHESCGIHLENESNVIVRNSEIKNCGSDAINTHNYSPVDIYNSNISHNGGLGIHTSNNSPVSGIYSFINDNYKGIGVDYNSSVNLSYCMVSNNSHQGIYSYSPVLVSFSNITYNNSTGLQIQDNNFNQIENSIIWGNNTSNYQQIYTESGVTSIVYSTVQGLGSYGTEGQQYYFGDGALDDDPVFENDDQHLSYYSNCVDAGTPWLEDMHMPFGLGGVRADLGMYGGPGNWFWGGNPIPDGSALIIDIDDTPQDQGGVVGVIFDKSVWDNFDLTNRVTHYSFWRHYDVNGNSIDTISDGNWQLMGTMQAQGFDSYAYEVNTIGDSSIANGPFNSCFTVIAHTQDSATFWYSNVLCGNSIDNLSPVSTDLIAEQTDPDQVLLAWNPSIDDDFAYSEIFSDFGFSQTNLTDTTTFDLTVEAGETVTYGLIHYDVNGNPSDTSWTTIQLQDDKDYIALKAGWNLISTNVTPDENNISAIMSSLTPGNLIFITGFNNGVSVFDPNGLPFLNTLNQFEDGYGYWVKVNQDDTLIVSGELISHDFIPDFNAGWNLVGYTQGYTQSIETYFDFLLFDDNLIYATSFNQGVSVYDPNGLPFLNTLTTVDDNFGYWVKLNSAYGGSNSMRLSSDGQSYSPNFMLVNGTSNLTSQKGEFIEVLNSNDEVVAKLEILHDGYVMTSALYGDDKLTVDVDGLQQGELLRFKYKNSVIDNGLVFNGDMELRKLNLEFNLTDGVMMYPNPTRGLSNIEFNIVESSDVTIEICDVSGRVISSSLTSYDSEGSYSLELDLQSFDSGAYFVKLIVNNQITYTDRIFKQ